MPLTTTPPAPITTTEPTAAPTPTTTTTFRPTSSSGQPVSPGWQAASDMFLASVDRTQDPCQDFYAYACNQWIATHDENTDWWKEVQDEVNADAKLALLAIDDSPGSKADQTLKSLKLLFLGCQKDINDTETRARKVDEMLNEFGGWPILKPTWNWANDVPARFQDFSYSIGWLFSRYQISSLLIADTRYDPSSEENRLQVSGLAVTLQTCPTNMSDPIWDSVRTLMLNTTTRLADALGISLDQQQLNKDVDDMVELEKQLCQIPLTEFLTVVSASQAHVRWPSISWDKYFNALLVDLFGYENISAEVQAGFYVTSPDYMNELDRTIFPEYTSTDENIRIFQNYLLWRLVLEYVQYTLPFVGPEWNHFVEANRLRQRYDGIGAAHGRGRRYAASEDSCLQMANEAATFALGRAYVDYKYGADGWDLRRKVLADMAEVINEFRSMLKDSTWMDEQSKENALIKADYIIENAVNQEFAFDDQQLDEYYDYLNTVVFDPTYTDVFDMELAVQQHELSVKFEKIGHNGTDRSSWGNDDNLASYRLNPLTVNAWYLLDRNSVTVPVAILQLPFYRQDFPYAVNFGGLATTVGHEVTHGFNAKGQQYDKYGNQGGSWISDDSYTKFEEGAACVDDQFSKFCYNISGTMSCVNADRTEEENLADNGGLKAAYGAYIATRPSNESPIPGFEDLSMEQVFFLSFAEQWCERESEDELEIGLQYGWHSPNRDRVIGTLQNFPPFARAWNCKTGDVMYPEQPCIVW